MRKLLFGFLIAAGLFSSLAFTPLLNLNEATVEQMQGLFIFHLSKPTAEYDYLGSVKPGAVVPSKEFSVLLKIMIKRAKEDFPLANGLIVHEDYTADAITLK